MLFHPIFADRLHAKLIKKLSLIDITVIILLYKAKIIIAYNCYLGIIEAIICVT